MRTRRLEKVSAITDRKLMEGDGLSRLESLAFQFRERLSVIVREKDLDGKQLLEFAQQIVEITAPYESKVLINSRADVALSLTPKAGVHLPENGIPFSFARRIMGENTLIGRSVHDQQGAQAAVQAGADYLFIAPVFSVPGKGPALGLDGLMRIVDGIPAQIPVFALGGISAENVLQLKDLVDGVASIRGIWINDLAPALENLISVSPPVPT